MSPTLKASSIQQSKLSKATPTNRGSQSTQQRTEEQTSEVNEFLLVIKSSTPNGRQKLFDKLDEFFVMGDPSLVLEAAMEQLIKQLFEILKDEDAVPVKEMAIN